MSGYSKKSAKEKLVIDTSENEPSKSKKRKIVSPKNGRLRKGDTKKNQTLITQYDLDPYDFTDEELVEMTIEIFRHYDLFNIFNVEENSMVNFINSVRLLYNPANSFHNFKHVWCVMQTSFQILIRGADQYLLPLDIFAVLIAAICHDIGHPGNNNAFEMATQSDLSKMYGGCILERHHASVTQTLLNSRKTDQDIIKSFSESEKERLFRQIGFIIMGTDMAKHGELVDEAKAYTLSESSDTSTTSQSSAGSISLRSRSQSSNGEAETKAPTPTMRTRYSNRINKIPQDTAPLVSPTVNKESEEWRMSFTRVLVHSADIGAQTQCKEYASRWVDRCYDEFRCQAGKEKKLGIVTSPFIHEIVEDSKKFESQWEFINGTIEPIWKALSDFLPKLRFAYDQLVANKDSYRERFVPK